MGIHLNIWKALKKYLLLNIFRAIEQSKQLQIQTLQNSNQLTFTKINLGSVIS